MAEITITIGDDGSLKLSSPLTQAETLFVLEKMKLVVLNPPPQQSSILQARAVPNLNGRN